MKKPGISPGWGGAREGSGRKPKPISEKEKSGLLRALRTMAKKEGKTWQMLLAERAYNTETAKEQTSALKLIADILITRESHHVSEKHTYEHGIIELPPLMKDTQNAKKKEEATA